MTTDMLTVGVYRVAGQPTEDRSQVEGVRYAVTLTRLDEPGEDITLTFNTWPHTWAKHDGRTLVLRGEVV